MCLWTLRWTLYFGMAVSGILQVHRVARIDYSVDTYCVSVILLRARYELTGKAISTSARLPSIHTELSACMESWRPEKCPHNFAPIKAQRAYIISSTGL